MRGLKRFGTGQQRTLRTFDLGGVLRSLPLLLLVLTLSATDGALAQRRESPLVSGRPVRLIAVDTVDEYTGELRYTSRGGTIAGFDGHFLILHGDHGVGDAADVSDTLRIPVASVTFAEVFTGRKRHAVHGAIAGVLLGTFTGYMLGEPTKGGNELCRVGQTAVYCVTTPIEPGNRLTSSLSGAGIGAALAGIIGYFIRTESWAQIDLADLQLNLGLR